MKNFIIFFILGIALLLLSLIFVNQSSPFKRAELEKIIQENEIQDGEWNLLDEEIKNYAEKGRLFDLLSSNAYIFAFLLIFSLFNFFSAFHLLFDKLFFKEFFEGPSLFDAVRRSLFFCLCLCANIYINIYRFDAYYNFFITILIVIIEIMFSMYLKDLILQKYQEFNKLQRGAVLSEPYPSGDSE